MGDFSYDFAYLTVVGLALVYLLSRRNRYFAYIFPAIFLAFAGLAWWTIQNPPATSQGVERMGSLCLWLAATMIVAIILYPVFHGASFFRKKGKQ